MCVNHVWHIWIGLFIQACIFIYEKAYSYIQQAFSYMSRMAHSCVWHGSYTYVTRLVHTSCVTYMKRPIHIGVYTHICIDTPIWIGLFIYVTCGSLMCLTWLIHMCDKTGSYIMCDIYEKAYSYRRVYSCMHRHAYMKRPSHIWHVTHSCVWHGSYPYMARLVHMCDMVNSACRMNHSCVWHGFFIHVTWHVRVCDMPHGTFVCVTCHMARSCVWHGSCAHAFIRRASFICVTFLIRICCMHYSCVWHWIGS